MSEYGFGYYDGDQDPQAQQAPAQEPSQGKEPQWFRDYMKKTSQEMSELRQKLAEKDAAEALRSRGYDPSAAALYRGDPAKVDEWLNTYGSALAKIPGSETSVSGQEEQEQPAGPPQSVVSPESQAALARMQAAGAEGAAAPQGSDQDLAARLAATSTPEEYQAIMRANGNPFYS
jgi:hypothetical protein